MPIQLGDVKLKASTVMDDVPEGGGAPSAHVIEDNKSNEIFKDISESDRARGRLNMSKIFVSVETPDTDTYLGANMIVARPPEDPNVSITLFTTGEVYDTRAQAQSRVESYLNKGPEWAGYLYENHIAGQRVIQLFQRVNSTLPNIGQTLVLVQDEGLPAAIEQYVRATEVSAVQRTFTYNGDQDYQALIVTVSLSDPLRTDFRGSPASRSFTRLDTATKMRDTVVADAGTYVGVTPLALPISIGDFTINAETIFTQLVPSSQAETPISDIRMNGMATALVATGAPVTRTLTLGFTTSQSLHVGAPIYPTSLSVTRNGVTLTDKGGLLMNAGVEVGQVDYDNGILTLSTNVFGTAAGSHTVTFAPAALPEMISEQSMVRITPENRSLSYVFTLGNAPLPGTMTLSYLAQGRWYVLRDAGDGRLVGSDSAYGAGTVSYTTGSVVVTLGALPDVGGALVIQSYSEVMLDRMPTADLANSGKAYVAINTDGAMTEEPGGKSLAPGSVTVGWSHGGETKTATDNGFGILSGDATGTVDYSAGVVRMSPNVLPARGTPLLLDSSVNTGLSQDRVVLTGGNIGTPNIVPKSVRFVLPIDAYFSWGGTGLFPAGAETRTYSVTVRDNGAGVLYTNDFAVNYLTVEVGMIDYATGEINVNVLPNFPLSTYWFGPAITGTNLIGGTTILNWDQYQGPKTAICSVQPGTMATVNYATGTPGADSVGGIINELHVGAIAVPNRVLRGVSFRIGASQYQQMTDDTLVRNIDAETGVGIPSGAVYSAIGSIVLTNWVTGDSPAIADWRGVMVPPSEGVAAPFTAFNTVFRTAAAPIRPGSLSILGTMQDGTTFNVTAGTDGKINGARVKGRVDYEYGLVQLYFVNPDGPADRNVDLTWLAIPGLTTIPADLVQLNSLRYNAVSYSYLPLDASLLGIDPVRLPSDGRVPIFRPGSMVVIGHTKKGLPFTPNNGQTINLARTRLSRAVVRDNTGTAVYTGYSTDLEAGLLTFSDVSGMAAPVTIEDRIEDMAVVRDVQISGELTFTRPMTHNYPTTGTYVSSAIEFGDMKARVPVTFDQASWDGVTWADTPVSAVAPATYNTTLAPIIVTNEGASTERFALQFTSSTQFRVIGEHVGGIATGDINTDCAPINPATGAPYFTVRALGWGTGWSAGNILRINTIGPLGSVWAVRTTQPGPEAGINYTFDLLARGDVDRP
ncbi:hypothetical protein [Comamonas antarctica]|uniref:hypothetical protein n=1 Tax=Comamonas antarctica TaxID=2743470 RepID=UPI0028E9FCF1|nr:hypothetical protein [Comamonas antarctica]